MNKIFNFLFFTAFYFGSLFASNIEFEADKTSLDTKNEYLLLEGNVSLKIENLQFKANKVSLDNKNKVFSSEKIRFSSLDNFLYGQTKFVGISEDKTIMKGVEFSSCPCEDKIWWVESEELEFQNSNNLLTAKKSRLIVQGKTLAYLNKANFPISAKRKTGILLPEISINERSGLDLKIPIYLNLKENLDLNVEPRLMTQRGYGITNQLRYLGKNYEGFFNSSILFDDESSFKTLERDEARWSYNLSHQQKVKDYVFFNLETSSTGDPFYLSDLGSFMSGLSRTFVLPQRTDLTFFDKNLYVKADINSFKLTNPLGVNQFQRMPGIEVRYFINRKNINFRLDSDLANFRKGGSFRNQDKQRVQRLILKPKFSYAFLKNNYLLDTSLLVNYIYLDTNINEVSSLLPTLKLSQSLKFYKRNKSEKLIFEPFLNISISDQKKILNDLMIDSGIRMTSLNEDGNFGDLFFSYQKDLNIGAKLLTANSRKKNLSLKVEKLFSAGKKSIFYDEIRLDLPEPFSIKFNYKSPLGVIFNSNISIDNNENFSSYKNTLKVDSKKYRLSFSHYLAKNIQIFNLKSNNLEKKKINSFDFTAKFKFSKNWAGGFKFINDLEHKKNINSVVSLDYENDGMTVGLAYLKSIELDWFSILENSTFRDYHKDRFRLFFELKGLGSIGRPKDDYLKRRSL